MKMKVKDLPYKRIEVEEIRSQALAIIQKINNASAVEDILAARKEMLAIHDEVNTQYSIAYMRFSLNTRDEFYAAEQEYYDEILPVFQLLMRDYAEAVLTSPLRSEIEKHLSPILIRSMENEVKASDPSILEEMQQENAIVSEYSKFMSSLIFVFRGEEMPLTILRRYMADDDRETRKEAYEVLGKTLDANRATFDDIYDRLVKIRTKMARKLGYENFIPLGYARMNRIDYTQENVEVFRANVLKDIVPVVASIKRKNAAKMGIDKLMFYDNDVNIPGGNPKPVGGKEQIFAAGAKMYREMSPQTDEFFRMMLETEAFDVDSRDGKWGGGYCTEFPKYRQPFILANFNGTEADVGVITHEAGHAFASWLNFDSEYPDLGVGGMETAETHSMSMEFFAWKYMEEFFGENADRYRYMHLVDSFNFLPYGTIVDAFQHEVYANPDLTPAERNAVWKKLEETFRPYLSTDGIPYICEGTRWQYQQHIFESPFYYIDYCLAQTAALQFLFAMQDNYQDAFKRYCNLAKQGGTKPFSELLEEAGLNSPFKEGALSKLAERVAALEAKLEL